MNLWLTRLKDSVPAGLNTPAELAGYARKVDVPGYEEEAGAAAGEPPRENATPGQAPAPAPDSPATPPPPR